MKEITSKSKINTDHTHFLSDNSKKRLLIAHKINIKDNKNSYYKEGIKNIFNDTNIYFNDKYKNIRVIVGKNKSKILRSKEMNGNLSNIVNYRFGVNKNRFSKQNINVSNNSNKKILRFDEISKSFSKKNLMDNNIIKACELPEMNNNTNISNKYDTIGKNFNIYGKRASICYSGINKITDGELKIIYRKFINIAEKNKKTEIFKKITNRRKNERNFMIKSNSMSSLSTVDKEMKSRLNLQEKILNKYKIENEVNQKLKQKIKKYTSKDNDNILMNQVDKYRNKIEKIEEDYQTNNEYNYYKTIRWISSLRDYSNDRIKNIDKDRNKQKNMYSLPLINSKSFNKSKDKDDLNNNQCYFGSNSNLHCDIDSHISPLYAFILSDISKTNEKITNTHIDNLDNKNNSIDYSHKLKKTFSVPSLKKHINLNKNNNISTDLNIEGINLLDYEIEMSKLLNGKRKKIINVAYNDKDIEPLIFAKSYYLNNYDFPKSIKNANNLHFY